MLVITNQTIGNAQGTVVAFDFASTDFKQANVNGAKCIVAETDIGTYTVCAIEDDDQLVAELRRLAIAAQSGAAFDDHNVFAQLQ